MTHSGILENYGLHRYALQGDDEGVRRALRDGADVNALDSEGRNAIMCTVSGERYVFFKPSLHSTVLLNDVKLAGFGRV